MRQHITKTRKQGNWSLRGNPNGNYIGNNENNKEL